VYDQNVIEGSEEKLQLSLYHLLSPTDMHKLKMSTRKGAIMVFKDKLMIRAKMFIGSN
jgi:hypothetical protein